MTVLQFTTVTKGYSLFYNHEYIGGQKFKLLLKLITADLVLLLE
jgi:hypothetical protein